jgi:hypothetical protein
MEESLFVKIILEYFITDDFPLICIVKFEHSIRDNHSFRTSDLLVFFLSFGKKE